MSSSFKLFHSYSAMRTVFLLLRPMRFAFITNI
jgi:hypothetical protein